MSEREARAALWRNRRDRAEETAMLVGKAYGIEPSAILGRQRFKPLPEARHEVMARLWESGMALAQIANVLGMDHTTVLYGVRKVLGAEYAKLSPGPGRTR